VYTGANELRLAVKRALPAGMYQLTVSEFKISQKLLLY
jgi:alpha-amylase